ncbi:MAG: hypothetical protein R6U98_06250 [Pirellulaceae bacterium]
MHVTLRGKWKPCTGSARVRRCLQWRALLRSLSQCHPSHNHFIWIREQLGVPPVEVHHEEAEDADEPQSEGPRPRHCAVCKGEMEYVGGTHRPSARRVMEFLWDDIVRAVDVCAESCPVRTPAELCWERAQAVKTEGGTLLSERYIPDTE